MVLKKTAVYFSLKKIFPILKFLDDVCFQLSDFLWVHLNKLLYIEMMKVYLSALFTGR